MSNELKIKLLRKLKGNGKFIKFDNDFIVFKIQSVKNGIYTNDIIFRADNFSNLKIILGY